jgi:putative acetyltransferase
MSLPVSVRSERPLDLAHVREVNEQAFGSPIEAQIVERLRSLAESISLVATTTDLVVGHILFTPVSVEPQSGVRVAGLGPMSVLPRYQRAGVGSQLVHAGLESCLQRGYSAVVVVGHPTYYPRFGFEPASAWGLTLRELDVPDDVFMVVELEAGVRSRLAGAAVRYREEFLDT